MGACSSTPPPPPLPSSYTRTQTPLLVFWVILPDLGMIVSRISFLNTPCACQSPSQHEWEWIFHIVLKCLQPTFARQAGISPIHIACSQTKTSTHHRAPTAPSTTRWSQLKVTFIVSISLKPGPPGSPSSTSFFSGPPTARIHDWGELIIAVNWLTDPNIPRLEIVKLPPWYSDGLSWLFLALLASALTWEEIELKPRLPTSVTMGVINPVGVATATEMSTVLYLSRRWSEQMNNQ